MRQKVIFQDLGLTDYFDTWQYQTEIHQKLKDEKKIINNPNPSHNLIFCEHHAVFTLGRSGSQENLIVSPEYLSENNIKFYKINRVNGASTALTQFSTPNSSLGMTTIITPLPSTTISVDDDSDSY